MHQHVLSSPSCHAKNSIGYPFRDFSGNRVEHQDGDKRGKALLDYVLSSAFSSSPLFQTLKSEDPRGQS